MHLSGGALNRTPEYFPYIRWGTTSWSQEAGQCLGETEDLGLSGPANKGRDT